MKLSFLLSILFLPIFATFNINNPSHAVEINCNSPVWKNKDRCKGKTTVKKKKKKKRPTLLTTTGEIKYPFVLEKVGMLDLSTGKTIPITLSSKTIDLIEIVPKEGEKQSINSDSILQWTVGDYSEVKFSGSNALASGGGFAAGALINPSPATPILLLASPFVGMMQGNKTYPEWRVLVKELGDDGRERQILLQAVNEQNAFAIRSLIATASGLSAGVSKSSGEVEILREKKLGKLSDEFISLESELLLNFSKDDICNSENIDNSDIKILRYKKLKILIAGLNKSLNKEALNSGICPNE